MKDWSYRKALIISNPAGVDLTDYQVKVEVDYDSDMQVNFNDIRFTDSDGETLLHHWREEWIDSSLAIFWVKVPSVPAAGKTIYMYFGNSSADSASDDASTFIAGADFNDGVTTGLTINTTGDAVVEVPSITSKQIYGLKVDDWTKAFGNPVLPKRIGKWDAYATRELRPIVSEDGKIVIGQDGKITAYYWGKATSNGTYAIGITKSSDNGLTWGERLDSPVISPSGVESSWYKYNVFQPYVMKRSSDGLLMMIAHGHEGSDPSVGNNVGVFTSEDGLNWTDQGQKLTITQFHANESTELRLWGCPCMIKRSSGDFLMLLEGLSDEAEPKWRIFGATASELMGIWTPLNDGYPIFSETGSGWEQLGVSNPNFIEVEPNKYLMAYSGFDGDRVQAIGFAYSTDLENWTRYSGNPVLEVSASGWDSLDLEPSFLVKEDSSYLRLYYNGFAETSFEVGLALCHQGRILHAMSPAVADGWVIGKDLDGVDKFCFEFLVENSADDSNDNQMPNALVDFASVPSPMVNTDWITQARFNVTRFSPNAVYAHQFRITYKDTDDVTHWWNGTDWQESEAEFGEAGLCKVKIWDDGTNFKADIVEFPQGNSILASVASIAKSSVKAFSDGRVCVTAEPFTSHHYGGKNYDNWIVRNYVSPEPSVEVGSKEKLFVTSIISESVVLTEAWGW